MGTELQQFDELKANISIFVAPTKDVRVKDDQTSSIAINVAKEIKGYLSAVEKKRKELVGPLNERVKQINEYVKSIVAPLESADLHVKSELNKFAAEREIIKQAELRKIEEGRKLAERKLAEEMRLAEEDLRAKHEAEQSAHAEAESMFGSGDDQAEGATLEEKIQAERAEQQARFEEQQNLQAAAVSQQKYDAGLSQIKSARKSWKCEVTDFRLVPKEFLIVTLNEAAVLASARAGVKEIAGVRIWQDIIVAIGSKTYMPSVKQGAR